MITVTLLLLLLWAVQVVSLADELVCDRPFAALVTLTLCKLKNLTSIILLNASTALSAAGMAILSQCKHVKQLVMAPPVQSKGPLMAANTQVIGQLLIRHLPKWQNSDWLYLLHGLQLTSVL